MHGGGGVGFVVVVVDVVLTPKRCRQPKLCVWWFVKHTHDHTQTRATAVVSQVNGERGKTDSHERG